MATRSRGGAFGGGSSPTTTNTEPPSRASGIPESSRGGSFDTSVVTEAPSTPPIRVDGIDPSRGSSFERGVELEAEAPPTPIRVSRGDVADARGGAFGPGLTSVYSCLLYTSPSPRD